MAQVTQLSALGVMGRVYAFAAKTAVIAAHVVRKVNAVRLASKVGGGLV